MNQYKIIIDSEKHYITIKGANLQKRIKVPNLSSKHYRTYSYAIHYIDRYQSEFRDSYTRSFERPYQHTTVLHTTESIETVVSTIKNVLICTAKTIYNQLIESWIADPKGCYIHCDKTHFHTDIEKQQFIVVRNSELLFVGTVDNVIEFVKAL
jgi:hypothetical protein